MVNVKKLLGKGLLKKDANLNHNQNEKSKKSKNKVSIDNFLKNILGTHLIEKKF